MLCSWNRTYDFQLALLLLIWTKEVFVLQKYKVKITDGQGAFNENKT